MFTQINDTLIELNFNPNIEVKVYGPDPNYLVEVREYPKNDNNSLFVDSYKIATTPDQPWRKSFVVGTQFYGDWEILVYKFILDYGLKLIYTHRYNDAGQLVRFNLETKNKEEAKLWVERIKEYQKIHLCNVHVKSDFSDLDKEFPAYYQTHSIQYYKTYNIGRYPKQSSDFRTHDHRKHGLLWFGNWKTSWSYEHPRNWGRLSSKEIVDDILGLS